MPTLACDETARFSAVWRAQQSPRAALCCSIIYECAQNLSAALKLWRTHGACPYIPESSRRAYPDGQAQGPAPTFRNVTAGGGPVHSAYGRVRRLSRPSRFSQRAGVARVIRRAATRTDFRSASGWVDAWGLSGGTAAGGRPCSDTPYSQQTSATGFLPSATYKIRTFCFSL